MNNQGGMMIFLSFPSNKFSKLLYTIFFTLTFSCVTVYSQTVIKEKIVINKIDPTIQLKINSASSISLEVEWNNYYKPNNAYGEAYIRSGNQTTGWTKANKLSLTQPVLNAGVYSFTVAYNWWPYEETTTNYKLFIDGNLVYSRTDILFFRNTVTYYDLFYFTELFYSGFQFDAPNIICKNSELNSPQTQFNFVPLIETSKPALFSSKNLDKQSSLYVPINLKIEEGSEYLDLYNGSGTVLGKESDLSYSDLLSSTFLIKNGTPIRETNRITATVSATYFGLRKTENVIVFEKSLWQLSISPVDGDNTIFGKEKLLIIEPQLYEGCYSPFPTEAKYNLEITKGAHYGHIKDLLTRQTGTSLQNLDQEERILQFYFVADGETPARDDTIQIKVSSNDNSILSNEISLFISPSKLVVTFLPPSISPGDTANVILKKKNVDGTLSDFPPDQLFDIQIIDGADYGTFYVLEWGGTTDEAWGINQGFIFIANEQITESSVQSTILVKTTAGVTASIVPVSAGKTLIKNSAKQLMKTNSILSVGQLWGTGTIMVVKDFLPELVILRPLANSSDEKISPEPKMPELKAEAQLKNFTGGVIHYTWEFTLRWTGPDGRLFNDEFAGKTEAQNAEVSAWTIAWENKTRGGNDIALRVTTVGKGKTYQKSVTNPFKIIGENPTVAQVKAGLSLQEQVVVYRESFPKWQHFNNQGFPIFGFPHGYGLMQLDNPRATDEQVWNWKENRAAGVVLLQQKRTDAEGYPGRIRAKARRGALSPGYLNTPNFLTDELLWKETFQRYNGGAYWWWHPVDPDNPVSPGEWKPIPGGSGYGAKAWDSYINVLSGRPPAGWN